MRVGIAEAVPAIGFLFYSALLVIVFVQSSRRSVDKAFMLYLASSACWSLGSLLWRLQASLFWNRVLVTAVAGTAILFFRFVLVFLNLREHKHWLYVGYALFIVVVAANLSGNIVQDTYFVDGVAHYEMGSAVILVGLYCYAYHGLSMLYLIRQHRRTQSRVYQNRVLYPIIGLGLIMLAGSSNFLPELGVYPIDHAASAINALLIAYAILRYQLLDISLVIRRGLAYSSITTILAMVYFLVVFIFSNVFRAYVYGSLIPALFVASAIAVVFQPMRDRGQLLLDRLFFREKYDAQVMLQELSELSISILDIDRLASLLLDRLITTIHIRQAYILVKADKGGQFELIARKGRAVLDSQVVFDASHPIVRWMERYQRPLSVYDLDVIPQLRALWAQEREDLQRMEAELFIPLLVREQLIGLLILAPKLSQVPYTSDEERILTTLANQTAVAIQNAWLYTDLEQSLGELKRMQARLIQTEKLSAVGEMVAGVSHEINNPLTAVIGYAQLLQATDLRPEVKEDLGRVLEAGLRVKRIVGNLLDFSRQRPPQKEHVDVNEVVTKSLEFCAHGLKVHDIKLRTDLAPDLPHTMADRYQLQQVFVNIINNAQQAMSDHDTPRRLTVRTERKKKGILRISFRDTGPGIPQKIMNRIFDPFFTTKDVGKGTGLGLSVSYGIVQEHEGQMWAESEEGRGASFFIELPVRAAPPIYIPQPTEPQLADS